MKTIENFLAGWKPFADLPTELALAGQITAFLREENPVERRRHFSAANGLYRLHDRYRELEIFRDGKNEKAEQFERLFAMPTADLASAIERKEQKELLGLLQFCFEIGRHEVPPRHHLMREFIHNLFDLEINAAPIKYSAYGDGVLYSGGGKSHDEMAQDFVKLGMGGGRPVLGGLLSRTGTFEFLYDVSSSAFKSGDSSIVSESLRRWVRNTGGMEEKIAVKLDRTRLEA